MPKKTHGGGQRGATEWVGNVLKPRGGPRSVIRGQKATRVITDGKDKPRSRSKDPSVRG